MGILMVKIQYYSVSRGQNHASRSELAIPTRTLPAVARKQSHLPEHKMKSQLSKQCTMEYSFCLLKAELRYPKSVDSTDHFQQTPRSKQLPVYKPHVKACRPRLLTTSLLLLIFPFGAAFGATLHYLFAFFPLILIPLRKATLNYTHQYNWESTCTLCRIQHQKMPK